MQHEPSELDEALKKSDRASGYVFLSVGSALVTLPLVFLLVDAQPVGDVSTVGLWALGLLAQCLGVYMLVRNTAASD